MARVEIHEGRYRYKKCRVLVTFWDREPFVDFETDVILHQAVLQGSLSENGSITCKPLGKSPFYSMAWHIRLRKRLLIIWHSIPGCRSNHN